LRLGKSRRHLRRYSEIAAIMARHGLGWALDRFGLAQRIGHHPGVPRTEAAPVHLREMLEELGPTFVKLGQLLSTRPDIVPEPYITELAKLQDTAPTVPVSQIRSVIESEFGAPLSDLYGSFDDVPVAAASLAQVHRATLSDGTPVIIKVQRPDIREQIETDIEIMYERARFLERHWESARTYGLTEIVDEFAVTIREELDFTREARNTDRLREVVSRGKWVRVPNIHWDLTTSQVLTMQEMRGTKITDVACELTPGMSCGELADRLASSFMEQVFVDGFFHADPHPGNVLVASNGEILLVDCGQVGRLDPENKAAAIRMLMAFEQENSRALADEILDFGIAQTDVDVRKLTRGLEKLLRSYYSLPARSVNMGRLLSEVLAVSAENKIRLPVVFAVLGKVFASIDGICRRLDPDFNFTEVARRYVGRAVRTELRSENALTELYSSIISLRNLLIAMPEQMERLMRRAVEGTFRLEFKHLGLEDVGNDFRSSSNRISIALIVAGTIVGSSIIAATGRAGEGRFFGVPTLGVLGYVVAVVFGIWLVVSIIRSGRHK
jgi:ubiquinone biosynthesis protein